MTYSRLVDDARLMSREQLQSMLAAANALQAGIPFSSPITGTTYHADALAELIEHESLMSFFLTPELEYEYRELMLRH